MTDTDETELESYYREAGSWADDRTLQTQRALRLAWTVAAALGLIALLEALALVLLLPLKEVQPYAVMVDRQTGYVEKLNLAEQASVVPSEALTRAMLGQYVVARESYEIHALKDNYRKVALWSAGDARSQYIAGMQASNPASPLAALPRQAILTVQIRSISPLSSDSALVRFATTRTDPGGQPVPQGVWAAVVTYRFSKADMSAQSRLENPLGFQVTRYARSAEIDEGLAGSGYTASAGSPGPLDTEPAPLATPVPGEQP